MSSNARRLAVPTLLSLGVLATGAFAIGAWAEDDDADPPPPPVASPYQVDDDGGIGILSDAAGDDSTIDGGVDDAITTDAADLDAPLFDAPPLFFDAPDIPGSPPEGP